MAEAKNYRNFIDGEWVESAGREAFEDRNPADRSEVVGSFQSSAQADVDGAVESARRASRRWRQVPAPKRAMPSRRYRFVELPTPKLKMRLSPRDLRISWKISTSLPM